MSGEESKGKLPKRPQRTGKRPPQKYAKFVNNMIDPKDNPMVGKSFKNVATADENGDFDARSTVRNAYIHAGYKVKPTAQIYGYALHKFKTQMAESMDNPLKAYLENMTVTHFAEIVACDDIFSLATAAGGALYNAYQNPTVKRFIDGLIDKGKQTFRSYFSPTKPTSSSIELQTSLGNTAKDGVSLNHIFSTLTETVPPESDPFDIPKSVYTNRATLNYSAKPNASGHFFLKFTGQKICSAYFSTLNNDVTYNPDSTTSTGSFVYGQGPLYSSQALMSKVKLEGFEIEIIPSTSFSSTTGAICFGFLTSDSFGVEPFGPANPLTFDGASILPFFRVGDVKQRYTSRMFPTTDSTVTQWTTADPDEDFYGTFICVAKSLASTATIQFRITMLYSLQPQQSALNLIRGKIPRMGPYTDIFMEWLTVKYPDIAYWPAAEVLKLYRKLQAIGSENYTDLIRVDHNYEHHHNANPDSRNDDQLNDF